MQDKNIVMGIDISKGKFEVALLIEEKYYNKVCLNNKEGFAELEKWLEKRKVEKIWCCMEATNTYWEALAEHLHSKGYNVSIANPLAIKAYGQSIMIRNKNDTVDARLIAKFCQKTDLRVWQPASKEQKQLQALVRRLESLQQIQQEEKNRLSMSVDNNLVKKSLENSISFLESEIQQIKRLISQEIDNDPSLKRDKELLKTIPGIGEATAASLLAEINNIKNYQSAKSVAAYAGLSPEQNTSGTIVKKTKLSKVGNSRLRQALYLPAVVAKNHNPLLKDFALRLKLKGKHNMVIICACMRKLLHLAFGVLKSGKAFDPNFLKPLPS